MPARPRDTAPQPTGAARHGSARAGTAPTSGTPAGPLSIGRLARRFGLSRSTLLYYDSIGLLTPRARSEANYRLYSPADVARMELIDLYRQAGLPLAEIARVLAAEGGRGTLASVLEARLRALDGEMRALRRQQQLVVALLRDRLERPRARALDKAGWIAILRATGMDEQDMDRWHAEFERQAPEGHQEFLESLGLGDEEIARIRRHSREAGRPRAARSRRAR